MATDKELNRWWNGLSKKQQAAALRSQRTGRLTEDVASSLRDAGLTQEASQQTVSRDLEVFLKARH